MLLSSVDGSVQIALEWPIITLQLDGYRFPDVLANQSLRSVVPFAFLCLFYHVIRLDSRWNIIVGQLLAGCAPLNRTQTSPGWLKIMVLQGGSRLYKDLDY